MPLNTEHLPAVSVILPVLNEEKYVHEAVESILSQTYSDFELIVVDDDSTDGTLEILRHDSDYRVRILSNGRNLGITKSLNAEISAARGRYIARQDVDDVSLPGRLEKQIEYMKKHPQIAVLGAASRRN